MKKTARKPTKTARTPDPRAKSKRRGEAAKAALIRTVRGEDERGIPYRKDIFGGGTTTTYGPTTTEDDDCDACYLVRRQKPGQRAKWSFYGPDVTLLRGSMASQGPLQGRWDDPESMGIVRAMESVLAHPERLHGFDGKTLDRASSAATRSELLDPATKDRAMLDAALRAIKEGGLVREGELPRPWRISKAVSAAAEIHGRPPTPREAFAQFVIGENARGRGKLWQVRGKTVERDLWDTKAQTDWYRSLERAGWGWLTRRRCPPTTGEIRR